MKPLLVREVMTIGIPICHEGEAGSALLAPSAKETSRVSESPQVCVASDKEWITCGWLPREQLVEQGTANTGATRCG